MAHRHHHTTKFNEREADLVDDARFVLDGIDDGLSNSSNAIQSSLIHVDSVPLVVLQLRLQAQSLPKRWTASQRTLALAMARHPRLGAASPAKVLSRDALRLIHRYIRAREHLLICGGSGPPMRDNPVVLSCFWDVDLNTGQWQRLPDLPRSLSNHCCALRGTEELWVFGGNGNYDAFIYSFALGEWSRIKDVFCDRHERWDATCVIYKDAAYVFGGGTQPYSRCPTSAPDKAFYLTGGDFIKLPKRPYADRFKYMSQAVMVGSVVVMAVDAECCLNISDESYTMAQPEFASECCNLLLALDLDHLSNGWSALPWPSAVHTRGVSLSTSQQYLHLRYGCANVVFCPCCGTSSVSTKRHYRMDLTAEELTWERLQDDEPGMAAQRRCVIELEDGCSVVATGFYGFGEDEASNEACAIKEVLIDGGEMGTLEIARMDADFLSVDVPYAMSEKPAPRGACAVAVIDMHATQPLLATTTE